MRPNSLKRHLSTTHPALAKKRKVFFVMKTHSLKKATLNITETFQQNSSNVDEVSYEFAMSIAKNKQSHRIKESLIKPSKLLPTEQVLCKDKADKRSQISLLDDTVNGRIDKLFQNIKDRLLDQITKSPFFSTQWDETTDNANSSQLLLYARFVRQHSERGIAVLPPNGSSCNISRYF